MNTALATPRRHPALPLLLALLLVPWGGVAADAIGQVRGLSKAGLLAIDNTRAVVSYNADRSFVPASTMKVLTALAALETWGRGYRFETDFYLDGSDRLWVKGLADPYLVSEELDLVARKLRSQGVKRVAGIGLDDSFFAPNVEISGRSSSDNPYDAPVTALAVNFNTINVIKRGGKVLSAEPQTPITATARRLGAAGGAGKKRVNLRERDTAVRYFGELLTAKLESNGIQVGEGVRGGRVPAGAKRIYRHNNSRTLSEIVVPMLKYSTNFVANALFLRLADPKGAGQVSTASAQRAMTGFARKKFGWRDFRIEDGAGLSRGNRLTPRQLIDVLDAFAPYRDLMAIQAGNANVRAKTGTLRGVSCNAGYVRRGGNWVPFALMINQPVSHSLRIKVASELAR